MVGLFLRLNQAKPTMAGKECTIFVVDVGASMGQKRHGRDQNDLDWSLNYVWDKIGAEVSELDSDEVEVIMGVCIRMLMRP